jgi:exopolyphosphatase/guanosine-5'-triphosphate,3'-diphosphate pyrophosphatase
VVSPDDLVRKYRIPFHEAETAGPALLEYIRIARAFKAKQIIVSSLSLRQGLLVDAAASNRWTDSFVGQVLHSAMSLGEKYSFDRNHATCVMDLCTALFRELQPEHQLDARYGVLLKVAAILHEIGSFVSNRSHHKHSMYLIMNSDVFGISRDDMLLVALVARYHRRSLPRITHEGFAQLDREMRVVVSKLAAILRVADALDRSHSQRIRDLVLTREPDQFVITSGNAEDVTLERLSLEEKSGMFEDLYGRRIILRATEAPEGKVEHAGG